MSSAVATLDNKDTATDKSVDKKEIEHEELENMMNAENKTIDAPPPLENKEKSEEKQQTPTVKPLVVEDGREVKPKKIPIGGIKMPGFFTRSKSKEKCNKDSENDGAEGELLEVAPQVDVTCTEKKTEEVRKSTNRLSLKMTNPFTKRRSQPPPAPEGEEQKNTAASAGEQKDTVPSRGRILFEAIRGPLENVLRRGPRPLDAERGVGRAGLASMETLDDCKDGQIVPPVPAVQNEDNMETVKLDKEKIDEPDFVQLTWRETLMKFRYPIGVTLLFLLALIIILCCLLAGGPAPPSSAPVRKGRYVEAVTSCGMVEGLLEDSAFAFRGIPYAQPPIGDLRWRPASPLNSIDLCWNGTFLAHNATRPCWQTYANGTIDGDEDCLTLDVVTPHVRYDTPLPVVILIGAESLSGGSTGKLRPSARYARSRDVIFVRPNFRVGVLGFLAAEVLSKSAHPPTSGNYGLSDILAALNWVNLNIRHFGGDPEQVTLLGHRSGATLTTLLATSKLAKGKFARVWVASGAAIFPGRPLRDTELSNERYLQQMRCSDAQCLRAAEAEDLLESVPDTWRKASPDLPGPLEEPDKRHEWLVLDGNILKTHPADVWAEDKDQVVNMVIGTTAHESISDKLRLKHADWTPDLVAKHVRESRIGKMGLAEEALRRYNSTFKGLVSMISDIRTVCPLLTVALQRPGVPFYVVTQPRPDGLADADSDVEAILGRYEAGTPEQRRYVSTMQQLFYYYVWHGKIPQLEEGRGRILDVGQDTIPVTGYPNCDFWISKDVVPRYARLD